MRIEEKAVELGFERVCPFKREFFADDAAVPENLVAMASLVDAEERHKIGREIHVFQK
jgi:signal transduction histidine kinase